MSEGMLAGLAVIVSGVGPGLGREITVAAVREGAEVMMAARTESRLRAIRDEVDGTGARVGWHVADIAVPGQCEALVAATIARFGHLDAVVHCAAVDNAIASKSTGRLSQTWTRIVGSARECASDPADGSRH